MNDTLDQAPCPPALASEANRLWQGCVETLRDDGFVRLTVGLYRYDAALTRLAVVVPVEMTPSLDQRDSVAQAIRRKVIATNANVVLTAIDAWESAIPGVR